MLIVSASRIIDDVGDLNETDQVREVIRTRRLKSKEVKLAPITFGWGKPIPPGYIQGAPSPLQAMVEARQLFEEGKLDALIISGSDHIKSDFKNRKEERNKLMIAYEGRETFLTAFDKVAKAFIEQAGISKEIFRALSEKLFKNYLQTWRAENPNGKMPSPQWFEPVSDFFRGVDCANPSIDFDGCLIVMTEEAAKGCEIPLSRGIRVLGCAVDRLGEDRLGSTPQIVRYTHMETSFCKACEEAKIDYRQKFLRSEALLDVYTCYPMVPVAFLLKNQFCKDVLEIPTFLGKYSITINGGLNLAKAPGNNTTLNHLIAMTKKLRLPGSPNIGGLHSNGAIGYLQGFAILKREH